MTAGQMTWVTGRMLVRALRPAASRWADHTRLLISRDYAGWSLDADALALRRICRGIGIRCHSGQWAEVSRRQALFLTDQFALLKPEGWGTHRIGFAYFHGRPGTGVPEFDAVHENLRRLHERVSRVQVSHQAMADLVLATGIDPSKVRRIPIPVDDRLFVPATASGRQRMRRRLRLPEDAFVVGSFQKDGNGWGEGNEPKLIKGPDLFLAAMRALKPHVPGLSVLLTGPARGYVKRGLAEAAIPFRHVCLRRPEGLAALYHGLDLYLVTSRQEGGPKAVLESMASGVPLVTTAVGQAAELVRDGVNGRLANVDDLEGLVSACLDLQRNEGRRAAMVAAGRSTAEANSLRAQRPLWEDFMRGFVAW